MSNKVMNVNKEKKEDKYDFHYLEIPFRIHKETKVNTKINDNPQPTI